MFVRGLNSNIIFLNEIAVVRQNIVVNQGAFKVVVIVHEIIIHFGYGLISWNESLIQWNSRCDWLSHNWTGFTQSSYKVIMTILGQFTRANSFRMQTNKHGVTIRPWNSSPCEITLLVNWKWRTEVGMATFLVIAEPKLLHFTTRPAWCNELWVICT